MSELNLDVKTPTLTGDFAEVACIVDRIEQELTALNEYNPGVDEDVERALRGLRTTLAALQCFHNAGTILKRVGTK